MPVVIVDTILNGCPYIPCANFATAYYLKQKIVEGSSVEEEWQFQPTETTSPWYICLLN